MIVHITRHAQVNPPALAKGEDPDYPRGDPPISDLGRAQARLLGQRLHDALLVGHGASTAGAVRHILRHGAPERRLHNEPGWNCALTSFRMAPEFDVIHLMDVSHLPCESVTSNTRTRDQVLAERAAN